MESTQLAPIPARQTQSTVDEVDLTPIRTYWQLVRQRFVQHRLAVIGLVLMTTLTTMAIVIPTVTGNAYQTTSLTLANHPPSLINPFAPFGFDAIGQNYFIRLMKALQTSLFVAFSAVSILIVVGVTLGSIAGYVGGRVDNAIMRLVDIILSIPTFFLIVLMVALWGASPIVVILAIAFAGWTTAARLVRGEFLSLRETDCAGRAPAPATASSSGMLPGAMASSWPPPTVADSVVVEATPPTSAWHLAARGQPVQHNARVLLPRADPHHPRHHPHPGRPVGQLHR
jgi:hypothetical protein